MPEDEKATEAPTVNGKAIVFREKMPVKQWWSLLPALVEAVETMGTTEDEAKQGMALIKALPWEDVERILRGTIESYGGEPLPEDLGSIDIFQEAIPLLALAANKIGERTGGLGEAGSGPT